MGEWYLRAFDTSETIGGGYPDSTAPADLPMIDQASEFGLLEKYQAYWLYVELNDDLDFIEFEVSGSIQYDDMNPEMLTFREGWNLLGLNLGNSFAISGDESQIDFESILRGAGDKLEEIYYLNPATQTGFYPADEIEGGGIAEGQYFTGKYVAGSGNWFLANQTFSLTPKLKTVFPPDSDFFPYATAASPAPQGDDVDRNREHEDSYQGVYSPGVVEDGEEVADVVFRFQPYEQLVEEILPLTISNRGLEGAMPEDNGQGILNYTIEWRPYDPAYDGQWNPAEPLPPADDPRYLDASEPEDSPLRTWLKVMLPSQERLLRPDGRVDPVVVRRAMPFSKNPVAGFVSTDIAGYTLVADRTGLPVNTSSFEVDGQGAPEILGDMRIHGELVVRSNAAPPKRVRVRCEVPPLAGTFEGKAYIDRVDGAPADPAFSIDLSISLIEDQNNRLRGIIDSERVLLYPRDVPLTGSKLTSDGNRYIMAGSFYVPKGDVNRYPYDRFEGLPYDDGVHDVDWNSDGKYDNSNPLPFDIDRAMTMFAFRASDRRLEGDFTETVSGLTPEPMNLEGNFELQRVSYAPRKRSELAWTNGRIIAFDRTGTTPYEERRSTIQVDRPLRIEKLWVDLDIDHPRVADLEIALQAPDLSEYQVFPVDATEAGSKNYDGGTSNLFESIVSKEASASKLDRERVSGDLAGAQGLIVGGASLFGEATVGGGDPTPNVPSFLDSYATSCMGQYSDLFQGTCEGEQMAPGSDEKVIISTRYFFADSEEMPVTDELVLDLLECEPGPDLLSSGDPLDAGSRVAVVVRADPNPAVQPDDWLTYVSSYRIGLSYPDQILQFVDAVALPSCEGHQNFPAAPIKDPRSGVVFLSATTPSHAFRSGALFVAFFQVKTNEISQTFASGAPPTLIPDGGMLEASLSLNADGVVSDLAVENVNITHPNTGDLTLTLVSPAGTEVVLMTGEGDDGNNLVGTTFDDGALVSINGAAAPFSGRFRPHQPLSAFDEESLAGDWTLRIEDTVMGNGAGTLTGWSLAATGRLSPDYSVTLTAPPTEWTLIVRDPVQGPEEPVPYPRLVRWGLRIETSGGSISGRVVDAQTSSPVEGARVILLGRERLPVQDSAADGGFMFDGEEFGTYTAFVTHPDYYPASETFRFFESEDLDFSVGDIALEPREGNPYGDYVFRAEPFEASVIGGGTAAVRVLFMAPDGTDLSGQTLTIDTGSAANPSNPYVFANPSQIIAIDETYPAGSHALTATLSPGPFPGSNPSTSVLNASVVVRDETVQWDEDDPDAPLDPSVFFRVSQHSFYTGTTDNIVPNAQPSGMPPDNVGQNFFLRDQAGFDVDRYPPDAGMPSWPGPEDSDYFRYVGEALLPAYCGDGSMPCDDQFDEYPRNVGNAQLHFRAFLSFNAQASGTALGTMPDPNDPMNNIVGVTCQAGGMPILFAQP